MKNVSLTQLKYLVTVADTKSFGISARRCFVTQPTLSMQIQKAEEELGIVIFDRSQQPIVATERGEVLIQQARKILQEADILEGLADEKELLLSGEYRLGVIPTLAPYLLPLVVPALQKEMPGVHFHLLEFQTESLLDALKRDELDAGILVTPLEREGFYEQVLFYEPFRAYVSRSHKLFSAKEIRVQEVPLEDLWILQDGHCFRNQMLNLCKSKSRGNALRSENKITFEGGSLEALKGLVDQDLGMTFLPELMVRQFKDKAELAKVRAFTKPSPVREVSLLRSRSHAKKRISDTLLNLIQEVLPDDLKQRKLKKEDGKIISVSR